MSRLLLRAAILAQGGDAAPPPVDLGALWQLDATRRPPGYTLSDSNQTAINTSGGSDYRRWVPSALPILPTDGRRYWEVLCAPGGAGAPGGVGQVEGFMGVVSDAQRDAYNAGTNPITLGSIGWRGSGALWASNSATAVERRTDLPPFGAGDVLMFVLDSATASLWLGRNGLWHDDPASGAPSWTATPRPAFHPQIQGRNPGEGGTLRSLPAQFSYPVPPGTQALGFRDPDLRIHRAHAFVELGWDRALSLGEVEAWCDHGGGPALSAAQASLHIEVDLS